MTIVFSRVQHEADGFDPISVRSLKQLWAPQAPPPSEIFAHSLFIEFLSVSGEELLRSTSASASSSNHEYVLPPASPKTPIVQKFVPLSPRSPMSPWLEEHLRFQSSQIPQLADIEVPSPGLARHVGQLSGKNRRKRLGVLAELARSTAPSSSSFNFPPRPRFPGAPCVMPCAPYATRYITAPIPAPKAERLIHDALRAFPGGATLETATVHPDPELAVRLARRRFEQRRSGVTTLWENASAEATLRGVPQPDEPIVGEFCPPAADSEVSVLGDVILGDAFGAPRVLAWAILPALCGYTSGRAAVRARKRQAKGVQGCDRVAKLSVVLRFFRENIAGRDAVDRAFNCMRCSTAEHLTLPDLLATVWSVLRTHPSLRFLRSAPEFEVQYARTVATRILFQCDAAELGVVTRAAFRRSRLAAALFSLDRPGEINHETRFFSYEHFYVLYCRFWELDRTHRMRVSLDALLEFDNFSLSRPCAERVVALLSGSAFVPLDATRDREAIGFPEFVWFLLCEADKGSETALRFWFRVADVDEDGLIGEADILHFVEPQLDRLAAMGVEEPRCADVVTQLFDMATCASRGRRCSGVSAADLRASRMQANFFDALFCANKFLDFEERDPSLARHPLFVVEDTPWDRYARASYDTLSAEELGRVPDAASYTQVCADDAA
eukprot:gnl/Chilomastix_cuspidata/4277.p1 GENE.gnl/Chilomastix_cuspidata/4277~~gnl/Chilomastix_cuspidata/4277.p1  ORF type:complete len:669 (-),score=175.44 gnl/Chilomastix_cuspidata/4277:571-2577(-)